MKYFELMSKLARLSFTQLSSDVTFMDQDGEFFAGELAINTNEGTNVLDNDHPYIKKVEPELTIIPEDEREYEPYPAWQDRVEFAHAFWNIGHHDYKDVVREMRLPQDVVDAFVLAKLNYQVQNGGFAQWHCNDYSECSKEVEWALDRINTETSKKVLEIVKKAVRVIRSFSGIDFDNLQLNELDSEYYTLNEQFEKDIGAYFENLERIKATV